MSVYFSCFHHLYIASMAIHGKSFTREQDCLSYISTALNIFMYNKNHLCGIADLIKNCWSVILYIQSKQINHIFSILFVYKEHFLLVKIMILSLFFLMHIKCVVILVYTLVEFVCKIGVELGSINFM